MRPTQSRILNASACLLAGLGVVLTPLRAADPLVIRPAVELEFPTVVGRAYVLESSSDFAGWNPVLDVAVGDGQARHQLLAAGKSGEFYRVASHDVRDLGALLEPIRAGNNVPALACAVVVSNRIVGIGVTGLRKAGIADAPVTLGDKWHHGSLTKSMTATLAAMLVEKGHLQWSTTLGEVFPDTAPGMNAAWRTVRLDWLCSNHGGAPGDLNASGIWSQLWNFQGTPRQGRRLLLEKLTALPPSSTPGTRYEYSNAGFSLAGHMLETVMNKAWEDLLRENLFEPLGMTSAGFGIPATPRHIDQPWGHSWVNSQPSPVEPGPTSDNPTAIGPSATVHCSVADLARYVAFHLAGHEADTPFLKRSAFVQLHTAVPNNAGYAYGWNVTARPWAGGDALTHAGSNTSWYSVIWMAPNRAFGVVALCNLATAGGANPGAAATDQVVAKMIAEFLN